MRHSASAFALAVGLLAGSNAAALAAKSHKPPPPPLPAAPAWSWTGFYVGGNVGYGWGRAKTTVSMFDKLGTTSGSGAYPVDGAVGGGQIGYNWQNANWVWGLEADFQGAGQRGSGTFICGVALFCGGAVNTLVVQQKLDWFGTVRGRLGWAGATPYLVYVTGGLAYGDVKTDAFTAAPAVFSSSSVKAGWTIGAGVEGQIGGNWTWKIEYLYLDLGTVASAAVPTGIVVAGPPGCDVAPFCPVSASYHTTFTDNIIRLGVNYKWP